jgi:hypothetical protein
VRDEVTIETDLFEHREVKPHFINPCCFGEDFAFWLREKLTPLTANGFLFAEPIQEDYGWGFWAAHPNGRFWIAFSYVGEGPQEEPAQWVVSINSGAGLNLIKRVFYNSHQQTFTALRDRIWQQLKSNTEIKTI